MATFPGELLSAFTPRAGPLPGLTRGTIGVPPPGLKAAKVAVPGSIFAPAPPFTPLGDPPPPVVQGNARPAPWVSVGFDWFDRLHVLPRVPLNFGRVTAPVDKTFEVYSAFRVPTIFNGARGLPPSGLSLPVVPAIGTKLEPHSGLLDPASTPGTPILLKLRATPDGAHFIEASIAFGFVPGGDAVLRATGLRFELLPFDYESGFSETLEWATAVLPVARGREQRIARREKPRQRFDLTFLLDGDDRRRLQAALFGAQGRAFGLPLWHERLRVSAATAPGATTIPVATTADVDLRVGGFALLWKDAATHDVVKVASIAASSVGLDADFTPANAYAAEDRLVPMRVVRLEPRIGAERHQATLERFDARATAIENEAGAPTGDLSPLAVVYGRPLLDGNVILGATIRQDYRQQVVLIDNQTGAVHQEQVWPRGKRGSTVGFNATTRAAILQLRRILYGLRGRQVPFWVPTGFPDLRVVADLVSAASTVDVANQGYVTHVQAREHKRTFRITFTDGTSLFRRVLSAVVVSATVERLTLDATWPANRTVAEVERVEFLELVRVDADAVELEHLTMGRATATVPVVVVHDDP